jgi:acyl-CoA reductase-like NAD-dependent aldehyde dehydrogenase
MVCHAKETFGPVVALYPFRTDDEAVALANQTEYGLNASILGRDVARASALAARVRAGTVNINDAVIPVLSPPRWLPYPVFTRIMVGLLRLLHKLRVR